MSELKTLKDLESGYVPSFVEIGDLKEAAIKWWKRLDEPTIEQSDDEDLKNIGKQHFIEEFFNLSEEDFE